jgi:hypothetical protein
VQDRRVSSPTPDSVGYRKSLVRSTPVILAIPAVIGVVLLLAGVGFEPVPFLAGVLGWIVALMLRAPVAFAAMRLYAGERTRIQSVITAASGPAEEIVRLVVLLLVGSALGDALWVGLGWGAIEVVYGIVNGAAILALIDRDDPEAEQVRALLPVAAITRPDAPFWGIVERTWATLLHIGFTLLVAANPAFVLLTIVLHSATNLLLLRGLPRLGLARLQLAGAAWTIAVLLLAALAWA